MGLAVLAAPSVHARVARYLIYVRRSYKEATAADVSDEQQEAACRSLLPAGATAEVITDTGGHRSGATTKRDGYQELLVRLRSGAIDGIAVYDLSRLHRNTENMLALARELERRSVPLLIALMPTARFDGANGRFMLSTLAGAAQLQRDLDSERAKSLMRAIFEAGRHRGHDPLGYKSLRDGSGRLVHPRQLVIEPEGAAIVRRVWAELSQHSIAEVAELLNREGVPHRGSWTRDAVKDILRRGRMYLGFVVEKRGRDERPGQHEPILTEAQYRVARASIAARTRVGNKPRPFRTYLLRGLVMCSCGTRMRGEAHLQRGTERRYYRCPTLGCRTRRCPADAVEAELLATIAEAVLPVAVIDTARNELRRRLQTPEVVLSGRQRARLLTRLEQLKKQHGWGDISDTEYQTQRDAVRVALRDLPDDDRVRAFDAYRTRLLELPHAIDVASPARREELCRIVVQEIVVRDRQIETIEWTPPVRPFFEKRQRACPQGDSNP